MGADSGAATVPGGRVRRPGLREIVGLVVASPSSECKRHSQ